MTASTSASAAVTTGGEPGPLDEDAARAVWLLVTALIDRGLPVPYSLYLSREYPSAYLDVTAAEHVTAWGQALDAAPVEVFSTLNSDDPTQRVTLTSVRRQVEGGTSLTVSHLRIETIEAAGPDAGEVSA